ESALRPASSPGRRSAALNQLELVVRLDVTRQFVDHGEGALDRRRELAAGGLRADQVQGAKRCDAQLRVGGEVPSLLRNLVERCDRSRIPDTPAARHRNAVIV